MGINSNPLISPQHYSREENSFRFGLLTGLRKLSENLLGTSNGANRRVDYTTNAWKTIDYEHYEIHSGSHYIVSDVRDLSLNEVIDVQFRTNKYDKRSHFTFLLNAEAETEWYIYEDATVITAGTEVTPINNDRNSSNTSLNDIAIIENSSVANANADTDVSGALTLEHGIIGASRRISGSDARERELILKQDTMYCMRAIANAAGYVSFVMSWYEHTNHA